MKRLIILLIAMYGYTQAWTQSAQPYQLPPKEILELADIKPRPLVRIDSRNQTMVMLERRIFKTLEEMAEEEVRLGGLRINPFTNGKSRNTFTYGISIMDIPSGKPVAVEGLPENLMISDFSFSPDERSIAFTNTVSTGIELWTISLATGLARKLTDANLNGTLGMPYLWTPDSESLLIFEIPEARKPAARGLRLPEGPSVQESSGRKAPVRTFQDLLRSPADEEDFNYYTEAEIFKVTLTAEKSRFLPKAIYRSVSYSPGGEYLMVQTIGKPYSYIVPYYRFPVTYALHRADGSFMKVFYERPLSEELPTGFDAVETGRRNIAWRSDQPATLYWVEALDEGNPEIEAKERDQLFTLDAPFTGTPLLLASTPNRYRGVMWGDEKTALITDGWWKTRRTATYLINPSGGSESRKMIFDRSTEDYYGNPGNFLQKRNHLNSYSLWFSADKKKLYLEGEGFSPDGNRPFLDEFDLKTHKTKRLWQADGVSTYETIARVVNPESKQLITSIESQTEIPNYYLRTGKALRKLTNFTNPYASFLQEITKERVHYKRADGVDLSATLYLPASYNKEKDGPLPMLMWAYPREFKDAQQAGQIKESPHTFVQLYYGSPVYWVARGFAVLDDADFPIIGEGKTEPNDTFIDQLVANAAAAIDFAAGRGVADRSRVAIGGHSYGAFMTANLLAHSDLFAAGIARSGAYNRTLTPFGFQAEERTFWEASEVYLKMSPFVHADKIKSPILLIHGDADDNSGTFTLQSERLFGAIKGLGGTARLVLLPFESHGYSARENVLHMLWETDQWLEKYVKNRPEKE